MIEDKRLYFSGALNLDIIFEIDDLSIVSNALGWEIRPGSEYIITHLELNGLMKAIGASAREMYRGGGGSAANTCVALSALGLKTAFIGACGLDDAGKIILEEMGGVDLKIIKRSNKTATCIIFLTKKDKDRSILVAPGTDAYPLLEVDDTSRPIPFLHLSSLPTKRGLEFHTHLVSALPPWAILSLDPGEIYSSLGRESLSHLLRRTDMLFITQGEYEMLFGGVAPKELFSLLNRSEEARPLVAPGGVRPPMIVIKKGRDGAELFGVDGVEVAAKAERIDHIVDNTGAGDAFNAGFIRAWLRGEGPEECLKAGNRLAALSLGNWGRKWLRRLRGDHGTKGL